MTDEFLTVDELAKYLKMSKSMVNKLRDAGDLPFIKLHGSVRFSKSEITKMLIARQEVVKSTRPSLKGKNPSEVQV